MRPIEAADRSVPWRQSSTPTRIADHAGGEQGVPGRRWRSSPTLTLSAAAGATPHGHRQADAAQRPRSDRPLLLRARPHRTAIWSWCSRRNVLPTSAISFLRNRRRTSTRPRAGASSRWPTRSAASPTEIKGVMRVVTGHAEGLDGRARSGGHLGGHLDPADDAVERRRGVRRLHARLRRRGAPGEERAGKTAADAAASLSLLQSLSRLRHAETPWPPSQPSTERMPDEPVPHGGSRPGAAARRRRHRRRRHGVVDHRGRRVRADAHLGARRRRPRQVRDHRGGRALAARHRIARSSRAGATTCPAPC